MGRISLKLAGIGDDIIGPHRCACGAHGSHFTGARKAHVPLIPKPSHSGKRERDTIDGAKLTGWLASAETLFGKALGVG
jgi:hypothetical protein